MEFKKLLEDKILILDGAMGTMLQAKGLKLGGIPEVFSKEHPEIIVDIHKEYIDAGANVVYTNTFGANSYKLKNAGITVQEAVSLAVNNAKVATQGTDALVALDIGPIGQMLEPSGSLSFEDAYNIFKEIVLASEGADLAIIETMTDLYEVKAAVLAIKENSDLPIMVTMTFEENVRTFTGVSPKEFCLTIGGLGVDAIGMNCSLGPAQIKPVIESISKNTNLPIVLKPNAGMPDPLTGKYDVTYIEFVDKIEELLDLGIAAVGGCCGTTPEYIKELSSRLEGKKPKKIVNSFEPKVCSATKTVEIDRPRIIGERINPTGKKRFKEALINKDVDYILSQAIEQIEAGAEILDVNVGLPDIDEKEMMVKVVKAIQSITNVPLQIDSTSPDVIEAALRVYNGKPIVNSVNGEDGSIEKILPLVKKYNACVLGLTIDEDGIPKTAQKRFDIAKKILDNAIKLGIKNQDVFIDCLTLTVSAEQEAVLETLKGISLVKSELGLKTALGVSNISFGLPNREIVNHNFLMMALTYGLDLPIINPNKSQMVETFNTYKVLANIDKGSVEYINAYKDKVSDTKDKVVSKKDNNLVDAIIKGMKNESKRITNELLDSKESLEIVNEYLIPALDQVGVDFEKGIVFLPQLIQSAEAAQAAFSVIKDKFKDNENSISKGKIILATVKGDVHDIGKNIVKVLLENYGYDVIDLGKDVEYSEVTDAIRKHNCNLVGLSALMTTTLVSMENTIKLIRKDFPDTKVIVGGAVLTKDYAKKIDADYYAKDAKSTVEFAKKILG